jgi:hypothetical protein
MDRSSSLPVIDWVRTWRGRREAAAVILFALLCVGVPLWCGELYPFSCAPMFMDAPQMYCDYQIEGPEGRSLAPVEFGVQRNYWGNPVGMGTGFRPPPTVDSFGEVAPRETVTATVASRLADHPELPYVDVVREVVGPMGDRSIGVVARERWRVTNPLVSSQEAQP